MNKTKDNWDKRELEIVLLKRNAESERRKRNNEFHILWDSNRNNEIGRN